MFGADATSNIDGAIFLDVDLDIVIGLEAADGLATRANDLADLFGVDVRSEDAGGILGQVGPNFRHDFQHLAEDMQAAIVCLSQGVFQ